MMQPEHKSGTLFWPALAAVGALTLCCAGPVLVAVLATMGLGAAVPGSGVPAVVGLGVLAVIITGVLVRRRRACRCAASFAQIPEVAKRPPGGRSTVPDGIGGRPR